jgi:hypothetical protein
MREKLTHFRFDCKEIKHLREDDNVVILIYLGFSSNLYILDILSGLSHTLKELFNTNIKNVEIKFLVMHDISQKVNFIKNPLVEHNEKLMKGLKKESGEVDEEKFSSLIAFREKEFQSLINSILMGLIDVEMKNMVLNKIEYCNIQEYAKEIKVDESIEAFRIDKNKPGAKVIYTENNEERMYELSKITQEIYLDEKYPVLNKLLQIICGSNNKNKKCILIVADTMRELIREYVDKNKIDESKNIYFGVYPTQLFGPPLFEKLPEFPGYYTILSRFYNEDSKYKEFEELIDELWFVEMLSQNLNSRPFKPRIIDYETISKGIGGWIEYVTSLKEMKLEKTKKEGELEATNLVASRRQIIKSDIKGYEDNIIRFETNAQHYKKIDRPKYQEALLKTMDKGFLTIQEDLISQLKLIL